MPKIKALKRLYKLEAQRRMEVSSKPINRLDRKEMYVLTKYIEMNHGKFAAENTTCEHIARQAKESLKCEFEINDANIRAAYDIIGLPIPRKKKMKKNKSLIIIRAVQHLYTKLGEPLPEEFKNLAAENMRRDI